MAAVKIMPFEKEAVIKKGTKGVHYPIAFQLIQRV